MAVTTNKCEEFDIYEDLDFCDGQTVLPGLVEEAYFIASRKVLKYPKRVSPSDAGATLDKIGTLDGSPTLAADSVFQKMDILGNASNLTSASQGETPSKTHLITLTLKSALSDAKSVGFCQLANADNLIYVVKMRAGGYRWIGNENFRTNTNPAQDSGMNVTDASGTTLEVTVTDISPAPYFVGELKTAAGTIDCSTGEIKAVPGA